VIGLAPNIDAFLEHRVARRSDEMTMPTGGQVDRFAAAAEPSRPRRRRRTRLNSSARRHRAICERAREIVQQNRELRRRAASH
jgi:hypothetical protein